MMMLLVGASKIDITPPLGGCQAGSVKEVRSETLTDSLYASAILINDGIKEISIISVDLCLCPTKYFKESVLPEIKKLTGIKHENIILSATHTHAGPVLNAEYYEEFGLADKEYSSILAKKIATAVRIAQQNTKPAYIAVGKGDSSLYNTNRRLKRKSDGSTIMSFCCSGDLSRFEQKGIVDNEMVVLKIDDEEGRPIAILVNYAIHNNAVGGRTITSDFAGAMRDYLEKIYDGYPVVLFLPGCCGNVTCNKLADPRRRANPRFPSLHKRIGMSLAGDVMRIIGNMYEYESIDYINIIHKTLTVLERPYCSYDTTIDGTFGDPDSRMTKLFMDAYNEDKRKYGNLPLESFELDICGISLGNQIALVTNPNELFVEYGLEIKEKSPYKYTLVAELTNGCEGYAPTLKAFEEGGYEVRKFKSYSKLEKDAGEKIKETSSDLLNELKQQEKNLMK
jgi:neutral ceramidase